MAQRNVWWMMALSLGVALGSTPEAAAQHRHGRRGARCAEGQHDSAGHCCGPGEEWVEARSTCVCLEAGGCRAPDLPTPPPDAATPSPAPTPAPVATRRRCPEGMVMLENNVYQRGDAAGERNEAPPHRVSLAPYCIDRTEVTVGRYRACVAEGRCTVHTTINFPALPAAEQPFWSSFCNGARTDRDDHPINCVDWAQADSYCRARGGRLPTEAEWELAARGVEARRFPWGDAAPTPDRVNACDPDCRTATQRPGRPPPAVALNASDGAATTAAVGSYPAGASFYGAQDMAGNVMEWTADWFGPYGAIPLTDPTGPLTGTTRVVRGGHWSTSNPAQLRTTARAEAQPGFRLATLGFRCVAAPEMVPVEAPPPPPPPPEPEPEEPRRRHRRR